MVQFRGGRGLLAKLCCLAEHGGLRGVLFLTANLRDEFSHRRSQGREKRQGILELSKFFDLIGVRDRGHGRRSG